MDMYDTVEAMYFLYVNEIIITHFPHFQIDDVIYCFKVDEFLQNNYN